MDVDMTTTTASSSSSTAKPAVGTSRWNTPLKLPSRHVRPDLNTPRSAFESTLGKETDPGRMAIYLCLLDDNPHLHPSLSALHKHRLHAHSVPLPFNPETDYPISYSRTLASPSRQIDQGEKGPDSERDMVMEVDSLAAAGLPPVPTITVGGASDVPEREQGAKGMQMEDDVPVEKQDKAEWVMWRYTEEEQQRRKAYLPLA